MTRATEELMDILHGTIAESLLEEMKGYKARKEPIPASLIAQAIKFLKDNGVDRAVRPGDAEDLLSKELEECELPSNVFQLQQQRRG